MPTRLRGVVILLVVVLTAAACGDDDGDGGFSQENRDAFLSGCVADGTEAFCECTLDELEKVYTNEEFEEIALDAAAADMTDPPEEFLEAVLVCIDQMGE
jgi:hypothetical protein